MTTESGTEVLIVGAGPVGLVAAHELSRHGLRVRVIDARTGPADTSRAIATHPRCLETYDQMGVIADVLPRGQRITAFTLYREGKKLTRLSADYTTTPTRYPFTLAIEQEQTEQALRYAMHRRGIAVEWGVRLETFEQLGDQVHATLRAADGTVSRFAVPWLLGCDGGHSTVRKTLGLPLLGQSSETWMIADARVHTDVPADSIYWVHTGGRTLMMAPLRDGRWRLLDTARTERDIPPQEIAQRFSAELSKGLGVATRIEKPQWSSVFTFQQRMVPRMQLDRCFVAGDAAHVHSPASGQGLNTGIQEAVNLAWKLAMVARGLAGPALLETYSAERVPVGEALLQTTNRATFLVQLKNTLAGLALPVVFAIVRAVPEIRRRLQRKILGRVSGLRLAYADSPLTVPERGRSRNGPVPGERFCQITESQAGRPGWLALLAELREPSWSLFVFSGNETVHTVGAELAERHSDWLSVRTIADDATCATATRPIVDALGDIRATLGSTDNGWALVRPDGYLAARGRTLGHAVFEEAIAPIHLVRKTRPVQLAVPAPKGKVHD
ncbi:FAD-dependent oxidoreductase [Sciscionella marina]|uniref:FAD-dependent oxidoreductase n=1 Tax=Sciscionella marina TaxID=508770 RepID=UPI000364560A|nr:FAD-dependent oxidoreductase [Sciscionella marina]